MVKKDKFLYKYTSLPVLFYVLSECKLTLLPPDFWDDKNDSYFLKQYKKKYGFETVLALCFSTCAETYHHWNTFAHGPAGVCIKFDQEMLINSVCGKNKKMCSRGGRIRYQNVCYAKIDHLKCTASELPFIKRLAFKNESEFRIVYECSNKTKTYDICISLRAIRGIVLSPWLPKTLQGPLIDVIQSIRGCERLAITPSTILDSEKWRSLAKQAISEVGSMVRTASEVE